MKNEEKWPKRGELIIGTVVRVNPFSVFIALEEYDKKEGMVHISEVAGKWVRDIRKFVKLGDTVVAKVMRVDPEKRHITLSLKRVRKYDAEEKKREYKKKLKAKKMLEVLAKKLKMSPEELNNEIMNNIEEIFGNVFDVFQMTLTPQTYDMLIRKGVKEEWAKAIKDVAEELIEIKEKTIKKNIELKSYDTDGVNLIKKILVDAKKEYNIDIKYISAPKYSLILKTKNPKEGERRIREAAENIVRKLETSGGVGKVE
ncbi:MAG: S1 RNA-binding domain-containing protein [Candidatus Aenigmarchaeota archaeon]|nr:S1 RNA-binding domain-containing protein [Candidatus Aenigmarchaeota archaeon]